MARRSSEAEATRFPSSETAAWARVDYGVLLPDSALIWRTPREPASPPINAALCLVNSCAG
jgi:hypothetical protein